MHPYLSGLTAEAHREDLLRDADQHRLITQARSARPRRGLTPWQAVVSQLGQKVRLLATPRHAAVSGCAPQPACCPA